MSNRTHESNAVRQKAYRDRLRARITAGQPATPPPRKPPRLTRPARLATLGRLAQELADEYTDWLEAIPANLAGGEQAERLETVIGQLEEIVAIVDDIEPPRIGR